MKKSELRKMIREEIFKESLPTENGKLVNKPIRKGSTAYAYPLSRAMNKNYPGVEWLKSKTKVKLLDDALDTVTGTYQVKVQFADGVKEIYAFQLAAK